MNCVLDASAAIDIAFNKNDSTQFKNLLNESDLVLAPDLFIPEITNVLWKYVQFEDLEFETGALILEASIDLIDEFIDSNLIYPKVFSKACQANHSAYDLFYLDLE